MAIAAKDVMALRNRTGVGMMECKSALGEADGDLDKAVVILREKLKGKMDERADRQASEGVLAIAQGQGCVAIIKLQSETDFAAKNDTFQQSADKIAALALQGQDGEVAANDAMTAIIDELRITIKENISLGGGIKLTSPMVGSYLHHNRQVGAVVAGEGELSEDLLKGLCQHISAAVPPLSPEPLAIDEAGLPAEQLAQHKTALADEARASGKPEEIIEKMITGKVRKWVAEHTLMGQIYIREMDAKKSVSHYIPKDAKITEFKRFAMG